MSAPTGKLKFAYDSIANLEQQIDTLRAQLAAAEARADELSAMLDHQRDAADEIERAPRWRDVAEELPQEAQEVLFVRGGKTVHGAWIGGIFWHSNQKMAAAYWMPLPLPPNAEVRGRTQHHRGRSLSTDGLGG